MEPNYIILMDFSTAELIKIKLSDDELRASEEYESFDEFLSTIEDKYEFRTKHCLFMTCQTFTEREYNFYVPFHYGWKVAL